MAAASKPKYSLSKEETLIVISNIYQKSKQNKLDYKYNDYVVKISKRFGFSQAEVRKSIKELYTYFMKNRQL